MLKDYSWGTFDNNGKLIKSLKYLVNGNDIFEYDTQFAPLDALYVAKKISVTRPGASTAEKI